MTETGLSRLDGMTARRDLVAVASACLLLGACATVSGPRESKGAAEAPAPRIAQAEIPPAPAVEPAVAEAPAKQPEAPPDLWRRYLAIIFDGLRPEGAHPLPHPAP